MTGTGHLIGIRAFSAIERIAAAIAANDVCAIIAVDHIGRVVADDIERCIAEQRHSCNGATQGEGVADVFRLALNLEVVLGDGQRLAGDGSEQVDPVARAGARIVVRKLQRGKGANQRVARVKNVNRQRHVNHGPTNVEELDIGLGGIDRTAHGIGDGHRSVDCNGNAVIGECAGRDVGVDAVTAVEDIAARTGREGVVPVTAIEDHTMITGDGRGIDLVVAGPAVDGDGRGIKRRGRVIASDGNAVTIRSQIEDNVLDFVDPNGFRAVRDKNVVRHRCNDIGSRGDRHREVSLGATHIVDDQGVSAGQQSAFGAAIDGILAITDTPIDDVVAGPATDDVVAASACERVVTISTNERIIGVAARERITVVEAEQQSALTVRGDKRIAAIVPALEGESAFGEFELLDIRGHLGLTVAVRAAVGDKRECRVVLEGVVSDGPGEDRRIGACTAAKIVIASAADQPVIVVAAKEKIVACTAVERVVAVATNERIVCVAACQRIIVVEANQQGTLPVRRGKRVVTVVAALQSESAFGELKLLDIRGHLGLTVAVRAAVGDKREGRIVLEAVVQQGAGEDRRVGACTAAKIVIAGAADQPVIAVATEQDIIAGPAIERIVVVASNKRIIRITTCEAVSAGETDQQSTLPVRSGQSVRTVMAALQGECAFAELVLLDIGEHLGLTVPIRTAVGDKREGRIVLEAVVSDGPGEHGGVYIRAAPQLVVAGAADQYVVTVAAIDDIVTRAAGQQICAIGAGDRLGDRCAVDDGVQDDAVIRIKRVSRVRYIDCGRVDQRHTRKVDSAIGADGIETGEVVDGRVDIGAVAPARGHRSGQAAQRETAEVGVALDVDAHLGECTVHFDRVDDHRPDRIVDIIGGLFESGDLDRRVGSSDGVVDGHVLDRGVAAILEQHDVAIAVAGAIAVVGEARAFDGDLADAVRLAVHEHAVL